MTFLFQLAGITGAIMKRNALVRTEWAEYPCPLIFQRRIMQDNVFQVHYGKKCRRDRRKREMKQKVKRFSTAIQEDDVLYQVMVQATVGTIISVVVATSMHILIERVVND